MVSPLRGEGERRRRGAEAEGSGRGRMGGKFEGGGADMELCRLGCNQCPVLSKIRPGGIGAKDAHGGGACSLYQSSVTSGHQVLTD